jgi:predicted metal-dependent hydrolase
MVHEKASNRERALLTRAGFQLHISPSKSPKEARRKMQVNMEKLLKKILVDMLDHRLKKYSAISGFQFKVFRVKKMKTRWGSCSSLGNLNFNIALSLMPIDVLDYIVVHELCHIKEPNHSSRFWAEVKKILPDYERRKSWLRENERDLLAFFFGEQGRALSRL